MVLQIIGKITFKNFPSTINHPYSDLYKCNLKTKLMVLENIKIIRKFVFWGW